MCFFTPDQCRTIDMSRFGLRPLTCNNCVSSFQTLIKRIDTGEIICNEDLVALLKPLVADTNTTLSNFVCPVLKTKIQANCTVASCKMYIKYPWAKNCLIGYLGHHGLDRLSLDEVSFLYQIPTNYLKQLLNSALMKLRYKINMLKINQKFAFVENTNVCCVCESIVDKPIPAIKGLCYCSEECRAEKPVSAIELEYTYGVDIEEIRDNVSGD